MKRAALILCLLPGVVLGEEKKAFDVVEAGIPEIQRALVRRELSSERLVQLYLDRIAAFDHTGPSLNAFLHLNEHALREARTRDLERRRFPFLRGPLFGVPVLLKDNVDTDDMPTTAG